MSVKTNSPSIPRAESFTPEMAQKMYEQHMSHTIPPKTSTPIPFTEENELLPSVSSGTKKMLKNSLIFDRFIV
jgi:hypothetical protein